MSRLIASSKINWQQYIYPPLAAILVVACYSFMAKGLMYNPYVNLAYLFAGLVAIPFAIAVVWKTIFLSSVTVYEDRVEIKHFSGLKSKSIPLDNNFTWEHQNYLASSINTTGYLMLYNDSQEARIHPDNYTNFQELKKAITHNRPRQNPPKGPHYKTHKKVFRSYCAILFVLFGCYQLWNNNQQHEIATQANTKELSLSLSHKPHLEASSKWPDYVELRVKQYPNFIFKWKEGGDSKALAAFAETAVAGDNVSLVVPFEAYESKLERAHRPSFFERGIRYHEIEVMALMHEATTYATLTTYNQEQRGMITYGLFLIAIVTFLIVIPLIVLLVTWWGVIFPKKAKTRNNKMTKTSKTKQKQIAKRGRAKARR